MSDETQNENEIVGQDASVKRKRGRPKGSKNKVKVENQENQK